MDKQSIWLILILSCLITWLTADYFDHRRAFKQRGVVEVRVVGVSCGGTRGSKITVMKSGDSGSLEVTRRVCDSMAVGQQITVLQSTLTGKFYWNSQPSKRLFWFYPMAAVMIGYVVYWSKQRGRKTLK
jgi:hypothetical protein